MGTNTSNHKKVRNNKSVLDLLGTQSALSTESGKSGPPDIRDVSLRWLAGTILTGVTSITLMGGALLVAVDGQDTYSIPSHITQDGNIIATSLDANDTDRISKGDRPAHVTTKINDGNVLHLSTLTRSESGNHVRTRPFARLDSSLKRYEDDPKFQVPPFDAVTIFSGSSKFREKGKDEVLYDSQIDDEIEIRSSPLPIDGENEQTVRGYSDEEIEAKIRQQLPTLHTSLDDGTIFARAGVIAYIDQARFEGRAAPSPFDNLVKIRSENVLTINKTNDVAHLSLTKDAGFINPKSNSTFKEFWKDEMGFEEDADPIISALSKELPDKTFKSTHKIRMNYAGGPNADIPDVISIYDDSQHLITIARADSGDFVPTNEPALANELEDQLQPRLFAAGNTSVYQGIYQTALKHNIPTELARELIRIYAFDVDFKSSVKQTDKMEVFYSLDPEQEKATKESEILYTSLQLGDLKRRYYRFKTTDDNEVDYYDENGRSAKKFLMRQPVPRAKFRSSYGWRRHPILRTSRLHKGVDWSAPRGTPIFAAGNGVIEDAKWFSGYGRWIKIRHANGYKTGYAHMSRFAKGMKSGVRVRQGQIIGYVGSTGLSTGPHLHYEVIVNGRHVDPMRIRLPRGRILSGDQLAAFERERNRIDQLLDKPDAQKEQDFALSN
ncbi:MAG: M23 family metallopeptidase [Hyphomicrobiales bacterium]